MINVQRSIQVQQFDQQSLVTMITIIFLKGVDSLFLMIMHNAHTRTYPNFETMEMNAIQIIIILLVVLVNGVKSSNGLQRLSGKQPSGSVDIIRFVNVFQ